MLLSMSHADCPESSVTLHYTWLWPSPLQVAVRDNPRQYWESQSGTARPKRNSPQSSCFIVHSQCPRKGLVSILDVKSLSHIAPSQILCSVQDFSRYCFFATFSLLQATYKACTNIERALLLRWQSCQYRPMYQEWAFLGTKRHQSGNIDGCCAAIQLPITCWWSALSLWSMFPCCNLRMIPESAPSDYNQLPSHDIHTLSDDTASSSIIKFPDATGESVQKQLSYSPELALVLTAHLQLQWNVNSLKTWWQLGRFRQQFSLLSLNERDAQPRWIHHRYSGCIVWQALGATIDFGNTVFHTTLLQTSQSLWSTEMMPGNRL